jgi:type IV secretion system protein VirD4
MKGGISMNGNNHKYGRFVSISDESRWADSEEIKNTTTKICVDDEECSGSGLIIISDGRIVYIDNTDTHALILGSTGSKKTRLFGLPQIHLFALAGESFIATDPKGELYQQSSSIVAAKGYKNIIVLNLREPSKSSCWNPLILPYDLYHSGKIDEAISVLNDFINSLSAPQRKGTNDPYFIEQGCQMFLGLLLFFIDTATPDEANISNFANFFMSHSSADAMEEISNCMAEGSIASLNLKGVLTNKNSEKTFGNVAACVSVMISHFITRKTLCQILSKSSFDIRNIGKEKTAIYIIVPDESTTIHFLVTVFIKQIYEVLIQEAQKQEDKKLPVRLNFLLDEFSNIPTIPDMPAMISAARSRNIRFFLMAQGMRQLLHKYGEDANTIMGNCDNWVFLTSREYELLQKISDLCGETLFNDYDGNIKSRPLISISELQRLNKEKGQALILHKRHFPYMAELPDIINYSFKTYPPIEMQAPELPSIIPYSIYNVISDIKSKRRPLSFSEEVYGQKKYFDNGKRQNRSYDLFDW